MRQEPATKKARTEEAGAKSAPMASDSERTAENPNQVTSITSEYRGVQRDKKNNRWRARLHTDKTRHVGYFDDEEAAARCWDQAA